jgi:protein-tyrosine phosphatase
MFNDRGLAAPRSTGTLAGMTGTTTERERLVQFEQAPNFRDLGGYPSRFGGTTRWGRVYRAAALHEMTPGDLDRFADLGIETVYDLRSSLEYDEHPDPVPSVNVPVLGRFMAENERPDFGAMIEHDHGVAFMRGMTINMLHWGAIEIGLVITGLADADRLPAVFHCTVGKDRTGIVAAILLEVLGVDREIVLDDFQLTDRYRGPHDESAAFQRMLSHGMPPEAAAGALGAPREMMSDALDELDRRYGDAERYLVEHGDVAPAAIERLRAQLLA